MKYKVTINNYALKNIPLDINKLQSNFTRDLDVPGIYIQEIFNLIFVGDGYCELKEIQERLQECSVPIKIEVLCDGQSNYKVIFVGVLQTAEIELNHELKQAKVKITDDSAFGRILENKDSVYNVNSETSIGGDTITPPTAIPIDILDVEGSASYPNIEVFESLSLLQGLLDWLTDKALNVQSIFFNKPYVVNTLPETDEPTNQYRQTYEVTYSAEPSIFATTTLIFSDFYGNKITRVITGAGSVGSHVANVWRSLLKPTSALGTITDKKVFFYNFDFDTFFDDGIDNAVDVFKIHSYFPVQIHSITNDETSVSWALSDNPDYTFIDSGINTCFLNGSMLRGVGHENFTMTFKDLIEDLNKMYNVIFTIAGGNFKIENEKYFRDTATVAYTFSTVKDLTSKPSLDSIFSRFTTGDDGIEIDFFVKRDFISRFCNLGDSNAFDAKPNAIRSAATIWNDLDNPDENNDEKLYCILGNSNVQPPTRSEGFMLCGFTGGGLGSVEAVFAPNLYINNNEQLIRHFQKFVSDLSVSPYVVVTNSDKSIIPYEYTFTDIIDQTTYQFLINNNLNKVNIKQYGSEETYQGIIQEIRYEYATGKAEITVWGQKVS